MEENKQNPSKYYHEDLHNSMSATVNYVVFSVGKKYKAVAEAGGFQAHMLREREKLNIPNADAEKEHLNMIMKGSENVVEDLAHYLSDAEQWKKNQVCARELLLSASKRFFDGLPPEKLDLWIQENNKFLEETFGSNYIFGIVHLDESVPHVHAMIATKFYSSEDLKWRCQHYRYFDGKKKLRDLNTKYSEHMHKSFPSLQRGTLYQKATHNEIQRIYGILNGRNLDMSEEDAKSKLQLQDIRLKRLEGTVENIKTINNKLLIENSELIDENKQLKEENLLMNKAVKDLMIRRHITEKDWELSKAIVQNQSLNQNKGNRIGS